jgi:hypothetical protein
MTIKTRSQLAAEFTILGSETTVGHHNNISKANAYQNLLDSVVVPGEETINVDGYRCTQITTDNYFDTTVINGIITVSLSDMVIKADNVYTALSPTSLTTNSSTSVLSVTVAGLDASSTYSAIVGARIAINTTGTPANCGYIDIIAMGSVVTDGYSIATFTFDSSNISVDSSKLKPAILAATGTIAASTGGFTISATRVAETLMSVSFARAWIVSIDEVI